MNNYETLFEHFAYGLRKPELDPRKRAEIIKGYMDQKQVSQREFAKRFGFPHSTIQDWLRILRLPLKEEQALIDTGMTKTDVYKALRQSNETDVMEMNELDFKIAALTDVLSRTNTTKKISRVTVEKIELLKKAINTFEFRLEKKK